MRGRTRAACAAALVAVLLGAAACSSSGEADGAATTTSTVPAGAPAELSSVTAATDWVLPGHDYDNSRAAGSTIDAATVRRLGRAWSHDVQGGLTTVPLIVGDTVYVQAGADG